jgi:single-strand DNA-binding protein
MSAQFTIKITSQAFAIPDSTGFQATGLVTSLNPDRPDIPITINAYGGNGVALSEMPIGHTILATGQLKIRKDANNNDMAVFVLSSLPRASNVITIVGRLGGDPEINYFESGSVVCKGSIAVSEGKDKPPSWFYYQAWGKDAERMKDYCQKGTQLAITGEMTVETWTDKATGVHRSKFVLKVSRFTFCGSKSDNQAQAQSPGEIPKNAPIAYTQKETLVSVTPAKKAPAPEADWTNDIPF